MCSLFTQLTILSLSSMNGLIKAYKLVGHLVNVSLVWLFQIGNFQPFGGLEKIPCMSLVYCVIDIHTCILDPAPPILQYNQQVQNCCHLVGGLQSLNSMYFSDEMWRLIPHSNYLVIWQIWTNFAFPENVYLTMHWIIFLNNFWAQNLGKHQELTKSTYVHVTDFEYAFFCKASCGSRCYCYLWQLKITFSRIN